MEAKQFRRSERNQILTVKWKMRWLYCLLYYRRFPLLCIKRDAPCQLQINCHFHFLNFPTVSSLLHIRKVLVDWPFLEISGPQKWFVGATLALKQKFLAGTLVNVHDCMEYISFALNLNLLLFWFRKNCFSSCFLRPFKGCAVIIYYYTSDSPWKIWLVESIQSIHNSLWTSAADIAFIMSSSTSAWLPSPLECSPQKQNGWMLRFCFWGWIMLINWGLLILMYTLFRQRFYYYYQSHYLTLP